MSFVPSHIVVAGAQFDEAGLPGQRTVFILHGIFGSGRNWRGFARQLVQAKPEWRAILVHLRGHAESSQAEGPHTLESSANDLFGLGEALGGYPAVVCGHSFGGKVALAYAAQSLVRATAGGGQALKQLWVLDSPPGAGAAGGGTTSDSEVGKVIAMVKELPVPIQRRTQVTEHLESKGISRAVATWMATNLKRGDASHDAGYIWNFSPETLDELLRDYWAHDFTPFLLRDAALRSDLEVRVVRALKSDRWSERALLDLQRIAASPRVFVHDIPDAGHWLHVDAPEALLDLMTSNWARDSHPGGGADDL